MESHKIEMKGGATGYLHQTFGYKSGKSFELCGSEILIGRNRNAQIKIFSPNVSRNHCSLHYTEDGWTIIDNTSFNGVYINTKKLKPNVPYLLKHGQRIYFGPPEDAPQSFVYLCPEKRMEFFSASNGKEACSKMSSSANEVVLEDSVSQNFSCLEKATPKRKLITNNSISTKLSKKRKVDDCNLSNLKSVSDSDDNSLSTRQLKMIKGNLSENPEPEPSSVSNDVISIRTPINTSPTLKECLEVIDRRLKESDKIEERVRKILLRSEECLNECRSQDNKDDTSEEENSESLLTTADDFFIGSDPYPFSQPLDDFVNTSLQDGRVSPISMDTNDNKALKNDPKQNLEERYAKLQEELDEKNQLQFELEKALSEKNELLKEQESMKKDKESLKSELETAKSYQLSLKDEVTAQFGELMEAEFTCGICTELFVKAVTLDCSHTFCEKCITEWKKKKKQCPICRAKTNGETRSLVIDNFIEKMVGKLSAEYQERRKSVVKDRLEYQSKKSVRSKKRSKRQNIAAPDVITIPLTPEYDSVQFIPQDDLLSSGGFISLSSDSESSVDGEGFYGGYGRCFNCGRRGHWANGCPE